MVKNNFLKGTLALLVLYSGLSFSCKNLKKEFNSKETYKSIIENFENADSLLIISQIDDLWSLASSELKENGVFDKLPKSKHREIIYDFIDRIDEINPNISNIGKDRYRNSNSDGVFVFPDVNKNGKIGDNQNYLLAKYERQNLGEQGRDLNGLYRNLRNQGIEFLGNVNYSNLDDLTNYNSENSWIFPEDTLREIYNENKIIDKYKVTVDSKLYAESIITSKIYNIAFQDFEIKYDQNQEAKLLKSAYQNRRSDSLYPGDELLIYSIRHPTTKYSDEKVLITQKPE